MPICCANTVSIALLSAIKPLPYGQWAGAVFAVVAHRLNDTFRYEGIDRSVRAANEAVSLLASWDELRKAAGKRYWFPGLLHSGQD